MFFEQSKGPFCQSCGMPVRRPEDLGTAADGARVNDYCRFCYAAGDFIDPTITMPVMIDKCAQILASRGRMSIEEAQALMQSLIPRLKRWRVQSPAA